MLSVKLFNSSKIKRKYFPSISQTTNHVSRVYRLDDPKPNFLFLKRKDGIIEAPVAFNIRRLKKALIIFQKKLCSRLGYNEK